MKLVSCATVLAIVCASAPAQAELRWMLDLEPMHLRRATEAHLDGRFSVLTVSAGVGTVQGAVVPYAMLGLGLLTAQIKLGAWYVPRGIHAGGAMARVELRPEISLLLDGTAGAMLSLGAGYRWVNASGGGRYVLACVEAGPVALPAPPALPDSFVRSDDRPAPSRGGDGVFVGASVALGVDW